MKIHDIYDKYEIPKNLQQHMIRVAAVAAFICEHSKEPVDIKSVISCELLHDLANIIKFNFDVFPQFIGAEGKEYWEEVKLKFIKTYGNDEHTATYKIAEEIGVNDKVMQLIKSVGFSKISENLNSNQLERKICAYSDHRVSPYGVVSLKERLDDGRKRYLLNRPHSDTDANLYNSRMLSFFEIEKQIMSNCSISPEEINDQSVAKLILNLANYEIETK